MIRITSQENKIFKICVQLESRKYRDKLGKYTIEGPNLVAEALENGADIESLVIDEMRFENPEIAQLCGRYEQMIENPAADQIFLLETSLFKKLSQTEHSQGILGIVTKKRFEEKEFFYRCEKQTGNVLVLDRLQDPGNVGTAIRTADAAGYAGVIALKGTVDLFSPKVVRACTGSLFRVPILFTDSAQETLEVLRRNGKKTVSTGFETDRYYYETDLKKNVAIIIGNEGNGICEIFKTGADELVKIPMTGSIESLNASVAAAILMYEAVRN